MRRLLLDIEANGLLTSVSEMHSLVIFDIDAEKMYSCSNFSPYLPIETGLELLKDADVLIGHNIYNLYSLEKLVEWKQNYRLDNDNWELYLYSLEKL
jgi:hypothetical protein